MKSLPVVDLMVIVLYLAAMVVVGFWFSRKNKEADQFTKAGGRIPGWAIGMSIYATFLSSNTFLGVPGKSFGGNWNAFVFSISMPLAAWVAVKFFVPFYRSSGEVSAYTHLEHRFGPWARTYAVVFFLLTQIARMGSVFFGIALSLQALTGLPMAMIMVITGTCIIIYTVLGGIEAVIWTEVVQAIVKTLGALLIVFLVIKGIPGGTSTVLQVGSANNKFSLGSLRPDFFSSSFWVVFFYGFFINLNNFGMDQNYVQRYHAAKSPRGAKNSLWLCVGLYLPASLLFFFIGTCLFVFYQVHPDLIQSVKEIAAREQLGSAATMQQIAARAAALTPGDYGDKVMPHFMVTMIPKGLVGLIVSAILSAAMSTISSGMNASATIFAEDVYKRYINPGLSSARYMRVLYLGTVIFGLVGMIAGIMMIGAKSILDVWWLLSGIFGAGMLGIFLLGLLSRRTTNHEALIASILGLLVILWLSLSPMFTGDLAFLKNPFDINMTIVIGTLFIFLVGIMLTKIRRVLSRKSSM